MKTTINLIFLAISANIIIKTNCFLTSSSFANDDELQILSSSEKRIFEEQVKILTNALTPFRAHIKQATSSQSVIPFLTCDLCETILPIILPLIYLPESLVKLIAIEVCKTLQIPPRPSICDPIITAFVSPIRYILQTAAENQNLNGTEICGLLSPDCAHHFPSLTNWNVELTGQKPPPQPPTTPGNKPPSSSTVTFLQFTDVHLDLDYEIGMEPNCGPIPICCRKEEGRANNQTSHPAGKFGDFMCALPDSAYSALLTDAKIRYPQTKYIFFTGDYTHSGVWLYNKTENSRHISHVLDSAIKAFSPSSTAAANNNNNRIKIYPVTGNHEPHVINMYPQKSLWGDSLHNEFDLSWLYETMMTPFLNIENPYMERGQIETFFNWGYYSVVAEPGLRFIFMNTNLPYRENYWLAISSPDPGDQLKWMEKTLNEAEVSGEGVYIIGHVEPGDCMPTWSGHFNRIVDRYEGVIKGMLFGHSHKPQYRIHFSLEKGNGYNKTVLGPLSIVSGSALTDGMNPAYSAYRVDGARDVRSWGLVRHEMMILKLGESNERREPVFEKVIDSWDDFGLGEEGLSGEGVMQLVGKMICDQGVLDKYLMFHYKGNDSRSYRPCSVTDKECLSGLISDFAATNGNDTSGVEYLRDLVKYTECGSSSSVTGGSSVIIGKMNESLVFLLGLILFGWIYTRV